MASTINVIDAVCGTGKTSALINYINEHAHSKEKFLYVTPFLTEIERIKKMCPESNFKSPENKGAKIYDIKRLFARGENIVTTHALFKMLDEETIDLAYLNEYTLIMDEVADIIDIPDISVYDMETLLEKYVEVKENGLLEWTAKEYEGEFEKYKKQCELHSLYIYSDKAHVRPMLIWLLPINVFSSFSKIYISSYLFDYQVQKYYYEYHKFKFNYWYVKDGRLTEEYQEYDISQYKELITICENERLNLIGAKETSFSLSWFERNKNNIIPKIIKKNCENYFRNIIQTHTKFNMWSTFKEYKNIVKGKGYTKGFVSLSTRATNDYIEKQTVAYLANRYINPVIKNFFSFYGIKIDENGYALSELLQFLFRSQIRVGLPINLYIPSIRMRNILKKWISEISSEK